MDAARLTHDTHLDYFVSDSAVDCHRDHLRVGDRVVKVLTTKEPPTVRVKLVGSAPFAKVTLVKDDVEIPLDPPQGAEYDASWTDKQAQPGKTSYYYVRGEQEDGELVWASPMWITYEPRK